MHADRVILPKKRLSITMRRLAQQLIENHGDFENSCIIGIQPRGVFFSDRIVKELKSRRKLENLDYGWLDITFYRDDFGRREKPLAASETKMDFIIEGKRVILIDDVLYTGRTINSALSALQHYGRPKTIELMTLIDRQFNRHLPITANYVGLQIDSVDEAFVKVCWEENDGSDEVLMFSPVKDDENE